MMGIIKPLENYCLRVLNIRITMDEQLLVIFLQEVFSSKIFIIEGSIIVNYVLT